MPYLLHWQDKLSKKNLVLWPSLFKLTFSFQVDGADGDDAKDVPQISLAEMLDDLVLTAPPEPVPEEMDD